MASSQTVNFGLNQWSAEDKVLREEFNADNAKIDAAILAAQKAPCCVTGSYEGGVEGGVTVELGFKPSFLMVVRGTATTSSTATIAQIGWEGCFVKVSYSGVNEVDNSVSITDNGFFVSDTVRDDYGLNRTGVTYHYAAFY